MTENAVTLRVIAKDTVVAITRLSVSDDQTGFVAPNAVSLAQALFQQEHAWYRGIYAGDDPVGFVMCSIEDDDEMIYLWRFMIDQRHQGNGYGFRAVELLFEEMRAIGKAGVLLSFVDKPGGPEPFYAKLGFTRTGNVVHGETEMALRFGE